MKEFLPTSTNGFYFLYFSIAWISCSQLEGRCPMPEQLFRQRCNGQLLHQRWMNDAIISDAQTWHNYSPAASMRSQCFCTTGGHAWAPPLPWNHWCHFGSPTCLYHHCSPETHWEEVKTEQGIVQRCSKQPPQLVANLESYEASVVEFTFC